MFLPALSAHFSLDHRILTWAAHRQLPVLVSCSELAHGSFPAEALAQTPLWLDSGGFAALRPDARVQTEGDLGTLQLGTATITPQTVMATAKALGAVTEFTLDFPSRDPALSSTLAHLGEANALWRLAQPREGRHIYAAVQPGQDLRRILNAAPDGVALGGLVPLINNPDVVQREIRRVRTQLGPELPLHVFGLGKPEHIHLALDAGATSVDSASPQRSAVSGRNWQTGECIPDPSVPERLGLAISNLQLALDTARQHTAS